MADFTKAQVGFALKNCGKYRVRRCQQAALQGPPDGISGAELLATGLGETGLQNVNGGLIRVDDHWEKDLKKPDKGVFQINSKFHAVELRAMPAVKEGTWGPVIDDGHTAYDFGYAPRFEQSLWFTLDNMHESQAYGEDHGVPEDELGRFALAAHNAGAGGALQGWREGDVDKYTANGEYSAWVERHARMIRRWLAEHPNWRV